jgi:large subunit ribosomal protein L9
MEIILLDSISNLGDRGQVVKVKPGYARNFLFPRKLALPATEGNKNVFREKERKLIKQDMQLMEAARSHAARLDGAAVSVAVQVGEDDRLYGSVTNQDIFRLLTEQGHELERRQIILEEPIKQLGEYEVQIRLHRDVIVPVKVSVTKG